MRLRECRSLIGHLEAMLWMSSKGRILVNLSVVSIRLSCRREGLMASKKRKGAAPLFSDGLCPLFAFVGKRLAPKSFCWLF